MRTGITNLQASGGLNLTARKGSRNEKSTRKQ